MAAQNKRPIEEMWPLFGQDDTIILARHAAERELLAFIAADVDYNSFENKLISLVCRR